MPILGSEQKANRRSAKAARKQREQDALRSAIASITSVDEVIDQLVKGVRNAYDAGCRRLEAEVACSFELLDIDLDVVKAMKLDEENALQREKARALEMALRQRYDDKGYFDLDVYLMWRRPVPHILVKLSEVPRP
jgi:hypothetical protein